MMRMMMSAIDRAQIVRGLQHEKKLMNRHLQSWQEIVQLLRVCVGSWGCLKGAALNLGGMAQHHLLVELAQAVNLGGHRVDFLLETLALGFELKNVGHGTIEQRHLA